MWTQAWDPSEHKHSHFIAIPKGFSGKPPPMSYILSFQGRQTIQTGAARHVFQINKFPQTVFAFVSPQYHIRLLKDLLEWSKWQFVSHLPLKCFKAPHSAHVSLSHGSVFTSICQYSIVMNWSYRQNLWHFCMLKLETLLNLALLEEEHPWNVKGTTCWWLGILWKAGCAVISAHQHQVCGFKQINHILPYRSFNGLTRGDFWTKVFYDTLPDSLVTLIPSLISPCVPQTSTCLVQSHSSPSSFWVSCLLDQLLLSLAMTSSWTLLQPCSWVLFSSTLLHLSLNK